MKEAMVERLVEAVKGIAGEGYEVLSKAWDSFWEDGDGWCYGNYLEAKMAEAGIAFDAYYADTNE